MDIHALWEAIVRQRADVLPTFFHPDACINWHCTNERFTPAEYVRANCEYPGRWRGELERVEYMGDLIVLAGRIVAEEGAPSLHVVSFLRVKDDKIVSMDEYFGDDGPPPQWRAEKKLGTPIR